MVLLFYTTYISVDLANHETFRAKVGKGGKKCYTFFSDLLKSITGSGVIIEYH